MEACCSTVACEQVLSCMLLMWVPLPLVRYSQMLPVHALWQRYVGGVLRAAGPGGEAAALLQLDLHGCMIRIAQHRDARLVGVSGVVAKYSDAAFHVVSRDDRLHIVARLPGCEVQYQIDAKRVVSLQT